MSFGYLKAWPNDPVRDVEQSGMGLTTTEDRVNSFGRPTIQYRERRRTPKRRQSSPKQAEGRVGGSYSQHRRKSHLCGWGEENKQPSSRRQAAGKTRRRKEGRASQLLGLLALGVFAVLEIDGELERREGSILVQGQCGKGRRSAEEKEGEVLRQ